MIPAKIIEPKQEEQVLTALDNISVKELSLSQVFMVGRNLRTKRYSNYWNVV